jgi:hypothetical protein
MSVSVTHREEEVEKVPIKTISKRLIQCEECKSNPSKYKCPGCSIQSCSLPCVKAHKLRTGCTGKRNQTQFVPISQFNDDILLSGTYFSPLCYVMSLDLEYLYIAFALRIARMYGVWHVSMSDLTQTLTHMVKFNHFHF